MQVTGKLQQNIDVIKNSFQGDDAVIYREFGKAGDESKTFCVIYINGMVDKSYINDFVIKPIIGMLARNEALPGNSIDYIKKEVITSCSISTSSKISDLVEAVLSGNTILFAENTTEALIIYSDGWENRSISEPQTEKVIQGPKESFNESLITNLALIRKRLRTSKLKCKFRKIGALTQTNICICYIDTIASKNIVDELEHRLDQIKIDGILDSGYIKGMIKDSTLTPFPLIGTTERPDIVCAKLLEGRVALLCDGAPFALTLPFIFMECFQANEDYYQNYFFASVNRLIRWIGFFLTTSVPAVYIALTTFHQEMIPTQLLLSISASRKGVPFPTIVEAILMLFIFEILREAGLRIPTVLGSAISIVGALVIGQAAVEAKLISAPMIIVAALAGITGFLSPRLDGAVIVIRFIFLILASFIGLYGYLFGVIGLFLHIMSLRSFGIPFMLNIGSLSFQDQKDMLIRAPWYAMTMRPKLIGKKNAKRKTYWKPDGGK